MSVLMRYMLEGTLPNGDVAGSMCSLSEIAFEITELREFTERNARTQLEWAYPGIIPDAGSARWLREELDLSDDDGELTPS